MLEILYDENNPGVRFGSHNMSGSFSIVAGVLWAFNSLSEGFSRQGVINCQLCSYFFLRLKYD